MKRHYVCQGVSVVGVQSLVRVFATLVGAVLHAVFVQQDMLVSIVTSFHVLVAVGVDLVFAMVLIIALVTLCFRMTSLVGAPFLSAPVRALMEEVARL